MLITNLESFCGISYIFPLLLRHGKHCPPLQNFQHDRDCDTDFEGTPPSTQSGLLMTIVPPEHAKMHLERRQKLSTLSLKGDSGMHELMLTQ